MRARTPPDERPRCAAILWDSGRQCPERAPLGATLCSAHVALLPPDEWSASGYGPVLAEEDAAVFKFAQFADLSQEIGLARVHLRQVVKQGGGAADLLAALNTVSRLIRLRHTLAHENAVLDERRWHR